MSALDIDRLDRDILATLMPGFLGQELPAWLAKRLRAGLGGVCLFGQNVQSPAQVRGLTDAIRAENPAAVTAIDEEGGDVTRLFYDAGSPYPGNAILGRIDDPERTRAVGARVGAALAAVGVNLDLAPDVDINSNPDNPVIGTRSFGTDADRVARHSAAWIRGLQDTGVAASAKHFPGHGDTAQDSHLAMPTVPLTEDALFSRELVPFVAAIEAGTRTIMTSHILLPELDAELPATLSHRILGGLLRERLGFSGVIVSDALDMHGASGVRGIPEAAVLALVAGCDLLCIGTENTDEQLGEILAHVRAAVRAGRLGADRVAEAAARVRTLGHGWKPAEYLDREFLAAARVDPDEVRAVAESIECSPNARRWLAAHGGPAPEYTVLRIDVTANIAVGVAPWGPFAAHVDSAVSGSTEATGFAARSVIPVSADTSLPGLREQLDLTPGPVLVVGKDLHRVDFARALIDGLRADGRAVLTADLGWPSPDRGYADIAVLGASRLAGHALVCLLDAPHESAGVVR